MASVKRPAWVQDKNANKPVAPKGVTVGVNNAIKASSAPPTPNRDKLDETVQSSIDRIVADPRLPEDVKKEFVQRILDKSKGKDEKPSFLGGVFGEIGKAAKGFVKPFGESYGLYLKYIANPVNNFVGSTYNELGNAAAQLGARAGILDDFGKAFKDDPVLRATGFKMPDVPKDADLNELNEIVKRDPDLKPSFDRWLANTTRRDTYNVFQEDKKFQAMPDWMKSGLTLGTQIATDPTTYVGVGLIATAGRAGRTALAIRLAEKYGPDVVDLNQVLRYGVAAVPRSIRQAENLSTGIRFGGEIIPKTEALGEAVLRGVGGVRAKIGDVLLDPNRATAFGRGLTETANKFIPKATRGLTAVGGGRAGTSSQDVYNSLVKHTMAKVEKGVHQTTHYMWQKEIIDFRDRQNILLGRGVRGRLPNQPYDPEAVNLHRYVEMPESQLLSMPISDELKQLARDVKAWQERVRNKVNVGAKELGDDFALNVSEVGYLDDYIHHRMTPEAREWMLSEDGAAAISRGDFRGVDMQAVDLTDPVSPMMFRRLRGETFDPTTGQVVSETFFGQPVRTGTIDEINKIFRDETGMRFDWFQTDAVSILDSYSFSMARALGRQAAVRRAFDFGPDVIRPMIKTVVPDRELVEQLTGIVDRLRNQANQLRARVNRNVELTKDYANVGLRYAEDFLNGQRKATRMNDRELAKFKQKLDDEIIRLTDASARAAGKSAAMRGDFEVIHRGLRDEIANLQAALNDPERYVAGEDLRKIYLTMYPNHNPASLANRTPEWFAEKILNGRGVPAAREIRTVNKRMKDLRDIIDAIPDGPEYTSIRQELESTFYDYELLESQFTTLADVRARATYSDTGLVYGHVDDLVALPDGVEPFKVFRTAPVDASTFDTSTSSVALRAIPEEDLIDFRNPQDYVDFFTPEEFGEHLATALQLRGMPEVADAFIQGFRARAAGQVFDPQFEQVYPEVADMIDTIIFHAQIDMAEDVGDATIFEAFQALDERLRNIIDFPDPEDVDIFAKEVMDDVLGAAVARASAKGREGLIVPQAVIDDLDLADLPDQYAVLVSPQFSRAKPSGSATGEVLSVADSDLVRSVRTGRFEEEALATTTAKLEAEQRIAELEAQQLFATEAKTELGELARRKGGLTAAQNKRMKRATEAYERFKATDSVEITIAGEKRIVTREQAQKQLVQMEGKVQKELAKLDRQIDAIYREERIPRVGSPESGVTYPVVSYGERVAMLMNQAGILKRWNDEVGVALARDVQDLRTLLSSRPPRGAAAGEAAGWVRRIDRTLEAIGQIQDPTVRAAYDRVTTLLHADEAQLALLEGVSIPQIERQLDLMRDGLVGNMIDDTLEGWEALTGLGVQMPEELLSLWKPNLEKLRTKKQRDLFFKAYDYTVRFFKTYATSTVGFFVRNGMSATFMNWVAGADPRDMINGIRAARAIGQGPDEWAKFLSKLSPTEAQMYEDAWRATEATGRGSMDELGSVSTRGIFGGRTVDNPYTRFYRRKNEFVERAVRMPLALDSLRKGQTFDEAVARITRYHFDYSDLSAFDEVARKFIPFWIWTSRNVPLQVVERLVHPSAYSVYSRIQESSPVGEEVMMPKWINEYGPIAVGGVNTEGGQWVLTPDLPMIRLEQQLAGLTDPRRLAGQLAPVFKLPIEFMANRQLGIDVGEFKDRPQPATGFFDREVLYPLAKFFGGDAWIGVDPDTGEVLLDERVPYIAQNAMPVLAQINRVTGGAFGGKASYQERQLGNILNWMGIPFRYVGPKQQESEAYGRLMDISDYLSEAQERGKITKKENLPKAEKPEELRRPKPKPKGD